MSTAVRLTRAGASAAEVCGNELAAPTAGCSAEPALGMRREEDPPWARPALATLLAATALLYLWGLGASGWANSFYSAAAQAGSVSWKAFLFGSSDAANSITVDKTPLSLWPMALSVRIFGLHAWSILVPQALEGVAAVALLVLTVKRWFGATAGLLAGSVLACTPVAVLMFRFNNPDAALVLLLVAATYFLTRALEDGRTRWMVAAGTMVGLGFLAKELQAFILLPVLVGAYLLAGPPRLGRRLAQCVALGASTLVAGGWWVLLVSVWPASSRPYFGGSQDNTFLNVLFGYNGLGRITGNETGSVVPGRAQPAGGMWGETGFTRLFNDAFGGQASWLIPTALLVVVGGLIWTSRRPRTDRARAALVLWGGWLLVTGLVFSLSKGIIHEYYTVALAPAIGALVGIGVAESWRMRRTWAGGACTSVLVSSAAAWSFVLLSRTPTWLPWLRWSVLVAGCGVVVWLLAASGAAGAAGAAGPRRSQRAPHARAIAGLAGCAAVLALFGGPVAYALNTAGTPHSGSLPTAGPAVAGSGGRGRFGPPSMRGGALPGGAPPAGAVPGGAGGLGFPSGGQGLPGPGGGMAGPAGANTGGGRAGGLLEASVPSSAVVALLSQDADRYDWVAATVGANSAAGYQLATAEPVMPIGGFNGSDPSPTLAQFKAYVAAHRIHWFIAGGGGLAGGGGPGAGGGLGGATPGTAGSSNTAGAISAWVQAHFEARTVGGVTFYDLTAPTS